MPKLLVCTALLLALGAGGCGGDDPDPFARPTATPAASAPSAPAGLDVDGINLTRDSFVETCREREDGAAAGAGSMRELREGARKLLDALEEAPDEAFRRSRGTREVTMRDLVRSLALIARRDCGGAPATVLGERMARAASDAA